MKEVRSLFARTILVKKLTNGEDSTHGLESMRGHKVEECRRYLENVPAIVPLLEKEYRNAAKRLEDTQEELNDLNPQKYVPPLGLKNACGTCEHLSAKLSVLAAISRHRLVNSPATLVWLPSVTPLWS